ncbi:hypothetical protein ACA910_017577 [Epithemia clementina (nom. ined.)]
MGNQPSMPGEMRQEAAPQPVRKYANDRDKYKSFPGSAILEKTFCGSIDTTDPSEYEDVNLANRLWKKADIMCISSPEEKDEYFASRRVPIDIDMNEPKNKASAMLARALVSEVTDNPKTMKQSEMAAREKQLLKAQQAAHLRRTNKHKPHDGMHGHHGDEDDSKPVGAPGGVGAPSVLSSLAFAVTGDETAGNVCVHPGAAGGANSSGLLGGRGSLQDGRAGAFGELEEEDIMAPLGPHAVTIGLSLSRRHSGVGHPETVTRQTAFDFNELQDRSYKYVSSTDPTGWRAGGGERGGPGQQSQHAGDFDDGSPKGQKGVGSNEKIPSPDVVHLPIIHINCESEDQVNQVIHSLASGEIFIPHMSILPEALSVNGISPPDLVVRFDCERNDDIPPDDWPNWCLEFMHNQLYEYFYSIGARWMKRPFSITLARKVKWKTVKHMNRYFAHAEQVLERWRERGPQLLDPQLSYVEGGATPEEVAHPHGIYLMRQGGVATNYFAPNFDPPYTTRMTRSLLENVLNKSWDRKRQEWSSEAIPKLVTPNLLLAMACGCTDPTSEGFMAREVTANTIRKTVQDGTGSGSGSGGSGSHHHYSSPPSNSRQQRPQQQQQIDQQQQQHQMQSSYRQEAPASPQSSDVSPPPQQRHQQQQQQQTARQQHSQQRQQEQPRQQHEAQRYEPHPDQSQRKPERKPDDHPTQKVSSARIASVEGEKEEKENRQDSLDDHLESNSRDEAPVAPQSLPKVETVSSEVSDGVPHRPSTSFEEKKTDEVSEKSAGARSSKSSKSRSKSKASLRRSDTGNNSGNAMDTSGEFGTSDFSASIAPSGTTVMHANVTKAQQKFSEDDWAQPIKPEGPAGSDAILNQQRWAKKKKEKQSSTKELLDQERKRQELLLQKVQSGESTSVASSHNKKGKSSHYKMTPVTPHSPQKRGGLELDATESAASMEYSQDGSSAYMTEGGSTLFGQQFATDSPSMATKAASSTRLTVASSNTTTDDEENSAFMSVQGSSSTMSVIPSDEELLAIGWAKAMDVASGNYYYYTLDRQRIVWDNPLSSNHSTEEGGSIKGAGMDP